IQRFVFHRTPTSQTYTLSLHDALPISSRGRGGHRWALRRRRTFRRDLCLCRRRGEAKARGAARFLRQSPAGGIWIDGRLGFLRADRKSTRLNSSHVAISYAVFCLKKKV